MTNNANKFVSITYRYDYNLNMTKLLPAIDLEGAASRTSFLTYVTNSQGIGYLIRPTAIAIENRRHFM